MRRNFRGSWRPGWAALVIVAAPLLAASVAQAACDDACLTQIADQYRAAYVHHDPKQAPFAAQVRFMVTAVQSPLHCFRAATRAPASPA